MALAHTKEFLIEEFVIRLDALLPSSGAVYLALSYDNSEVVSLIEDNKVQVITTSLSQKLSKTKYLGRQNFWEKDTRVQKAQNHTYVQKDTATDTLSFDFTHTYYLPFGELLSLT